MFNRITALLLVLLLIASVGCLVSGCSEQSTPAIPNRFVEIDEDLQGYAPEFGTNNAGITSGYVVDRYSRVVYVYYYDTGSSGGIDYITLYEEDGATPLRYTGELPN